MPCQEATPAWRPANGGPLHWSRPISGHAGVDYYKVYIPCGTCILCRNEQARQWAVRITHEAQQHKENSFITLTYEDEQLPQWGSLDYSHLREMWDRLRSARRRKALPRLRYYAVGEYGDQTLRPHYHACIFGEGFTEGRKILRTTPTTLWTSPELEEAWGHGQVSVGILNFATARYTASYVTKKLRAKQQYVRVDEETGELIPLEQPRAFMSRNIAKNWWGEFHHQVIAHDQVVINGETQKPPKAYDRWLFERSETASEIQKTVRIENSKSQTKEQTHARARNAHAHAENKSKTL